MPQLLPGDGIRAAMHGEYLSPLPKCACTYCDTGISNNLQIECVVQRQQGHISTGSQVMKVVSFYAFKEKFIHTLMLDWDFHHPSTIEFQSVSLTPH